MSQTYENQDGTKTTKESILLCIEHEQPDPYNDGIMKLKLEEIKIPVEQKALLPGQDQPVEICIRFYAYKKGEAIATGMTGIQVIPSKK